MPSHLSSRSRPKTFAGVFGQEAVTRVLINDIVRNEPHHVILSGPSGTGKSTLANLYAPPWLCHQPGPDGSPCQSCEACRASVHRRSPDFRKVRCPSHGNKEDMEYVLTHFLDYRPFVSRYRVVLFDEAQALSLPAQEMLLATLERERSEAICIFTLISADALIVPLQDRARKFQLEAPNPQQSMAYLTHLTKKEGIEAEAEALKLIAAFSTGYRRLAESLDIAISHTLGHRLTLATVRGLFRDRSQSLLDFLGHCAEGRLGEQLQCLNAMRVPAPEKLAGIIELLKHLFIGYVGPARVKRADHRLSLLLPDEDCRRVVGQLAARAAELGRTMHGLFDEILEFWLSLPPELDDNRLEGHAVRFHQLMMFSAAEPETRERVTFVRSRPVPSPVPIRSVNWRMRDNTGVVDRRGDHLALIQAREAYEAGTFLAQAYGRPFNARFTANHGLLPEATDEDCAERLSNWLKRLRQSFFVSAVERYGPSADLHRIAFHERAANGALRSTVLLHLPPELEANIAARLSAWSARLGDPAAIGLNFFPAASGPAAMAQHWKLLRELWGGLDPDFMMDGMRVLDVLQVPQSLRRSIGKIECRRLNFSQSIGEQARGDAAAESMGHLSAWTDREWKRLFSGWELREHQDRIAEITRRDARLDETRRSYSTSEATLERSVLQAALAKEKASWGAHPHDRPRKWRVWGGADGRSNGLKGP